MAMENKRITQLSTERLNLTSGDYVMVDDEDNGSAKYRLDRLKETDSTLSVSGMAADAAATGQAIDDEATARGDAVTAEASARQSTDTTLQENITAEATARQAADTALGEAISAEAQARQQAITAESQARSAADAALGEGIGELNRAINGLGLSVVDGAINITYQEVSE